MIKIKTGQQTNKQINIFKSYISQPNQVGSSWNVRVYSCECPKMIKTKKQTSQQTNKQTNKQINIF